VTENNTPLINIQPNNRVNKNIFTAIHPGINAIKNKIYQNCINCIISTD